MSRTPKIDLEKLEQMITKEKKSLTQCAKYFGTSIAAVSKARKKLGIAIVRNTAIEYAPTVVKNKLDAIGQLQKINDNANELLDLCMRWQRGDNEALRILESHVKYVMVGSGEKKEVVKQFKFKDPRELALRAMAEIRNQLGLQIEIFKTLYDAEIVQEFMKEIVHLLAEVSPELRNKFIERIREKKALNSAVSAIETHGP